MGSLHGFSSWLGAIYLVVPQLTAAQAVLPHTVVLPSVSAPEPAGSKPRTRKQQKKKKKSAAQKAEERADKECWRCRQLGHYEVDCPQPAAEPMETTPLLVPLVVI